MASHPARAKALRRWAQSDPVLHAIALETREVQPTLDEAPAFEALVSSIAHQQVSLAAGRTIFGRVKALGATPKELLAAGPDALRAAGLSRSKVAYVLDLAARIDDGRLPLHRLHTLPDEEVLSALTAVKGIGVWTAKMHLLFHLGRPDVLPHEDLGLRLAVAEGYGVPREKAAEHMKALAQAWSPHASYASLVLWAWRRRAE